MTKKYESELEKNYEKIIKEIPIGQIKSCIEYQENKKEYHEIPPESIDSAHNTNQLIDNLVTKIQSIIEIDETEIRNLITIDISEITIDDVRNYVEQALSSEEISIDNEEYILYLKHNFIDYFSNNFSKLKINNFEDLKNSVQKVVRIGLSRLINYDPITGERRSVSTRTLTKEEKLTEKNKIDLISDQFANLFAQRLLSEKCKLVINHKSIHESIKKYNEYDLLKNVSSTTRTENEVLTDEEEKFKNQLFATDIIKETYKSANEKSVIILPEANNGQSEIFLLNGKPLPMYLLKTIMNKTENTKKAAMNNIYSFLWNQDIILRDRSSTEYIINVENIHILGIKKEIIDDLKNEINSIRKNGVDPKVLSITNCPNITNHELSEISKNELINIAATLNNLSITMNSEEHTTLNFSTLIKNRTENLNKAQNEITNFLKKDTNKIDTLIYLIYKKTKGAQILTIDKLESTIEEIFDEHGYLFEKEFIDKYRSNNLFYKKNSLIHLMLTYKSINKNELEKKYKYIEEAKDYLAYIQRQTAYDIITTVPEADWKSYFENLNKNYNLGYFGLADFYINNELLKIEKLIEKIKLKVQNREPIDLNELTKKFDINIFKIYDKTLYLNHFNYLVDIKKVYITDLQDNNDANIICEMEAIHETLLAFFKKNPNNINQYKVYSAQNIDEATIKKYAESSLKEIISFNNHPQQTLFCLVEHKRNNIGGPTSVECYSNIITQAHSDFKRKKYTTINFIEALKRREIILRYATAKDLVFNDENIIASNSFSELEKITNNLISCSNAITWLNELTQEEFKEFSGIKTTYEEFIEIKTLLFSNIIDNLKILYEKVILLNESVEDMRTKKEKIANSLVKYLGITTSDGKINYNTNSIVTIIVTIIEYICTKDDDNLIDYLINDIKLEDILLLPKYIQTHILYKIKDILEKETLEIDENKKEKIVELSKNIGINIFSDKVKNKWFNNFLWKTKNIMRRKPAQLITIDNIIKENEKNIINHYTISVENLTEYEMLMNVKILPTVAKNISLLQDRIIYEKNELSRHLNELGISSGDIEIDYKNLLPKLISSSSNKSDKEYYQQIFKNIEYYENELEKYKRFHLNCLISLNGDLTILDNRYPEQTNIEEMIKHFPEKLITQLANQFSTLKHNNNEVLEKVKNSIADRLTHELIQKLNDPMLTANFEIDYFSEQIITTPITEEHQIDFLNCCSENANKITKNIKDENLRKIIIDRLKNELYIKYCNIFITEFEKNNLFNKNTIYKEPDILAGMKEIIINNELFNLKLLDLDSNYSSNIEHIKESIKHNIDLIDKQIELLRNHLRRYEDNNKVTINYIEETILNKQITETRIEISKLIKLAEKYRQTSATIELLENYDNFKQEDSKDVLKALRMLPNVTFDTLYIHNIDNKISANENAKKMFELLDKVRIERMILNKENDLNISDKLRKILRLPEIRKVKKESQLYTKAMKDNFLLLYQNDFEVNPLFNEILNHRIETLSSRLISAINLENNSYTEEELNTMSDILKHQLHTDKKNLIRAIMKIEYLHFEIQTKKQIKVFKDEIYNNMARSIKEKMQQARNDERNVSSFLNDIENIKINYENELSNLINKLLSMAQSNYEFLIIDDSYHRVEIENIVGRDLLDKYENLIKSLILKEVEALRLPTITNRQYFNEYVNESPLKK